MPATETNGGDVPSIVTNETFSLPFLCSGRWLRGSWATRGMEDRIDNKEETTQKSECTKIGEKVLMEKKKS